MTVAQCLKKIRKKHGLSQKAMAELIGVSPGAVCRWEKGDREISDWVIKAYSAAFHVPETYFFEHGEETRSETKEIKLYAEPSQVQDRKRLEERMLQYFRRLTPQKQEQYLEKLANDAKTEEIEE